MRKLKKSKKIFKKSLHFLKRCGIISKPSDEAAKTVGVDYYEGPPVPIPNTEVKLVCADNTWLETARDDRLMPTLKEPHECVVLFLFSLKFGKDTEKEQLQIVKLFTNLRKI